MDGLKEIIISKIDDKKKSKILDFYIENKLDAAKNGRMETTIFVDRSEDEVVDFYAEKIVEYIEMHSDTKEVEPDYIFKINGIEMSVDQMLMDLEFLKDDALARMQKGIVISDRMRHAGYLRRLGEKLEA